MMFDVYRGRPLAYSTLADLVHHVRQSLSLSDLALAVNLFSKNVHDESLPCSIQTMSCKLLLNLVECIRAKSEAENGNVSHAYISVDFVLLPCTLDSSQGLVFGRLCLFVRRSVRNFITRISDNGHSYHQDTGAVLGSCHQHFGKIGPLSSSVGQKCNENQMFWVNVFMP